MRPLHPWMLFVPGTLVLAATLEGLWMSRRAAAYDWRAYFASLGDLVIRSATGVLPLGLAAGALGWVWQHRLYTDALSASRGPGWSSS